MNAPKSIRMTFLLLVICSLITSCRSNHKLDLHPNLPVAKNSFYALEEDSALFSIQLKKDTFLVSDMDSAKKIYDSKEIGDYLCAEIQNKHINPKNKHLISLAIDSTTPNPFVDKLFEELELLGFYDAYFKTVKNGYYILFSWKGEGFKSEVCKLYGERFENRKYIINDCRAIDSIDSNGNQYPLPTPPGPGPPPISPSTYYKLKTINKSDRTKTCLIEFIKGELYINRTLCQKLVFDSTIKVKYNLFIKLNKYNTYNDLIKILDAIYGVELKILNDHSLKEFNKKYLLLSDEQKKSICRNYGYWIYNLSLSEQNYINELTEASYSGDCW